MEALFLSALEPPFVFNLGVQLVHTFFCPSWIGVGFNATSFVLVATFCFRSVAWLVKFFKLYILITPSTPWPPF
jgi:hypothetical protein